MIVLKGIGIPLLLLTAFAVLLSRPAESGCLPSAESVKHAFPDSHPLWTKRDPGRKGKKCWLAALKRTHADPSTRAQETPVRPRKIKSETIVAQNDNVRLKAVISALVFPPPVVSFSDRFQFDSFSSRFTAVAEAINRPSYVQRLMDPVGIVP